MWLSPLQRPELGILRQTAGTSCAHQVETKALALQMTALGADRSPRASWSEEDSACKMQVGRTAADKQRPPGHPGVSSEGRFKKYLCQ